jgi:hypothetical protein
MLVSALEHHMLQHVRYTGYTIVLIAGADLVPHLGDNNRRAVVLLDDQLEAIVQPVFMHGTACQCQMAAQQEDDCCETSH